MTFSTVHRFFSNFLFLICMMAIPALVRAGNFPVTNGNNTGAGSLRQAIIDANAAGPGPHTITFSVTGVITITSSLPAITVPGVTIDGGGTVTISGPAANNNTVALIILNTGANNATIKGLTFQNTGVQPITINGALSGVTLENLWLRQTGADYMNYGIYVGAAATNMTIRNVTITDVEKGTLWAIRFRSTVTGLTVEGLRVYNSGANHISAGNDIRGIQFEGAVSNSTIKNSTLDLDAPGSTDDGNYGIYCNTTVSGLTLDSVQIHDAEIYDLYVGGAASNINLNLCVFDNFDGWTSNQQVRFNSNATGVTIDSCTFNADMTGTADDGNNAIWFNGNMQSVNITKSTFTEADYDGIYAIDGLNNDNITISGNTFVKIGTGGAHAGVHFTTTRNTTSDGGPVLISDNTFRDLNGVGIYVRPNNTTTYIIPNFTIRNNIITGCKVYGGIKVNYIDKIVITQNSIYNNTGNGIDLTDASTANCGYEGANKPQLLSSAQTSPGVYTVQVKMPAICGTNACSIELFSNEAGVKGVGGQHYIQTFTGLGQGTRTLTNVTGAFSEITAAPYGTWTATLRAAVNCGTSEFSNKIPIKVNGPAGVDLGIKLWLRGDDISVNGSEPTADGQVITGWEEFSGGGGPSANSVINNPVVRLGRINFNPVADMDNDGIRGVLPNAPSWITTNTTTTVGVFNPLSATVSGDRYFCLFSQAGSDANVNQAQIEFYRTGNNINSYRGSTLLNPPIAGTTGVKAFDRPGVFSSVTTGTNHTSYYNGANMGSGNYNKGNFAISQWFIGTGYNSTNGWSYMAETDFAEVFTYNRTLTALELQKVQSYMAMKYGIAMKQNYILSNGTQVWDVSANATYSKEIAALVKDNLSILHQKQARAFHTDEVVSIGLGPVLAATNKDNDGTITNDLSVFMWGNDSASTALTQAFTAGTFSNTRMTRIWKVQKTNWSDQDITIKLNGGKDNNFLLISTDPTFATISQELKLNKDGAITISSSLLPDGVYFTFGRQQRAPGGVLSDLDVWVKADEGVTLTGTNATAVEDQSASQRKWPKVNTRVLNVNNSAINYNAAFMCVDSTYFSLPQFTNTYTQGEVFSVQSSAVNTAGFPYQLGGNGGGVLVYYRYTDNNMYLHWGTNARRQFSFGTKNMALPAILNVNTLSNSWTASLDGKVYSTAAYTTSFPQYANGSNAIGVGYGSYFRGPLSEVIQYKRKLTTTERQQVNSYMALKYGVTLDQTTPTSYLASNGLATMWNAADNTGFNFNIAGIGRDDNGSLYQKQSRSINTAASGNVIAMATGSELAVSNADNTDSIENDKSFLVWADNNGAITYTTNVTGGANVTLRMPRVWKVDKTNWNDQNITIKLYGSARNTYLLISNSDATFATIDQEIALNDDSTISINSNLLPDGAYFTFGKEITGPGFVNSGVQMWLRADDGVSSNDTWFDYSGNDANAKQATVANQPVLTAAAANFNPAFRFNGTSHYMDVPYNAAFNGNITVYTVHSQTAASGFRTPVSSRSYLGNQSKGWNYYRNISTREFWTGNNSVGTAWSVMAGGATTINTPEIIGLDATLGSGNAVKHIYSNGLTTGTVTNGTYIANTTAPLRIGASSEAPGLYWNGDVVESVVYNRVLSAVERSHVESYLALKYGITLNQSTPTDYVATNWDGTTGTKMWTASKNTGYGFRIAGIGRDDLTKLYQKQSFSAEANALITIAAGTSIASDNASNTASIDDMTFFTWSDNNGSAIFSTAVTGVPNATFRMQRVWKVDRTNWSDQDITINADKIGVRYLLVNTTDPTFGAGTTEYILNTTTSSVTLSSADLPDGAYFTLATKIVGPGCVNNGIQMWLRADYGGTSSDWPDFSGNQVSAAQAVAANQPVLQSGSLNFNPSLKFDGAADYLQIPQASITGKFPAGNAARTIIGVALPLSNATDQAPFTYGVFVGNQSSGFRRSTTAEAVFEGNGNPVNVIGPANSFPLNKTTLISGRYTGGAAGVASLYTNGLNSVASATRNWATLIGANGAQVGKYAGEARYWNGNIGELILYNRNVTDEEFQRISSYLALKYGITMNQSTPTDYLASDGITRMWTAADNTGYNFRITGIGRDDCDELHQKQSRNQDGGLVTISIGSALAATNAENTDSIQANNAYLVFGDNNLDTTWSTPVTATGLTPTVRMPRIWKVDKTNWTDQSMIIKFNRKNANTFLLISTDPTFATGVQELPIDPTDSVVALTSDLLPDGVYFTFGKEVYGPGYVNNGIQVWLRADDSSATGSLWSDFSGNDNDAAQATAASQPASVASGINYNPAFDFDGTDDYLDVVNGLGISGTNPFTLVGLGMRQTATSWDAYVAQPNANTNDYFFGYQATTNLPGNGATGVGTIVATTAIGANVPNFIGVTRSGNNFSFYSNGKPDGTPTGTYNFNVDGIRIGNRNASADLAFDGYMGEVFVYNRVLNATELQRAHSYLSLKYGITLNAGNTSYAATDWDGSAGTIYWDATANAGYKNNIAGIGRDDKTSLLQKQSRSVNTAANGNMVAIGLGSIAATNAANTATFDDDMSYMVWGDNGLTNTKSGNLATAEVPAMLDLNGCSKFTRLQREWKVQETGALGAVQVQFYLTGLVPNSATISEFSLLIDDDGDFASGSTSVVQPATYDAATQTLTFSDVDFANGQYFTLVTDVTNEAPGGVISNLYVWYRADKGVTTTTGVSQWNDQSTSLKNATGTNLPAYNNTTGLINFNPAIAFDGTNDVLSNAAVSHTAGTNGEDIFAVVLPNTATGVRNVLGLGNATAGQGTELRFSNNILQYSSKAAGTLQSIANGGATNGLVQLANANRSNAGAANLLLNGTSVATGTISQQPANTALNIGARRNAATPDQFFNGQIAEVAIYNTQLLPADREKIASYLAIKYGITLSHNYVYPNNTVVWDQTTNTGYGNNITAIGRDDCNGLHQKQSKSVNAGAMITMASGGAISASNADNLNGLENNTALLFGDNNAAINAWTATEAPAGRNRVAREWKLQLTGTVGTVFVQVPASTSAATAKLPAEINKVYMLVDADGDFSSGVEEVQMTQNGDNWEVSYEFSGNAYFTFATGSNFLVLTSKAILQGAWDGTVMRTDLKTAGVLPATDPYGLNTTPSVNPNAASAAVVDWIKVELRDANDPTTMVASRAAFVLANGNIVDTGYAGAVAFYGVDAGNYYVVINHRNHLGVMSLAAADFSAGTATIDFTNATTGTNGSFAQVSLGGSVMGLWAGNVSGDNSIRHSAKPSDASGVASAVLTHGGNTTADPAYTGFSNVYNVFDVNLDGKVYYSASPSDRTIIVNNVITHPANTWGLSSFIITAQLP